MSWTRTTVSAAGKLTADPLAFLQSNLVIVPFNGDGRDTPDEPIELVLYTMPPDKGAAQDRAGNPVGLYFLTLARILKMVSPQGIPAGPPFKAYFCPYRDNDTLGTTISSKANMMFTTAMDGCSFGIGSATPSGARMVYHSNLASMGSASAPTQQGDAQNTTLSLVLGSTLGHIFGPNDYRSSDGGGLQRSTTVGLRALNTGQWHFFSQVYSSLPAVGMKAVFQLREVKQIV